MRRHYVLTHVETKKADFIEATKIIVVTRGWKDRGGGQRVNSEF